MTVDEKKAHEITMKCFSELRYREQLLSIIFNRLVSLHNNDFELYNATYTAALNIIDQLNKVE